MTVGFGLLGDIETWVNGQPVNIGHFRQRSVLAALLVDANRSVPADRLVDRIWADRPPQRAHGTLYGYLSHLRKVLRACTDVAISRSPQGYVLRVDPAAVDLHRFRQLIAQAGSTAEDDQRLSLYDQALVLWRSEPFGRLDSPWFNGLRDNLEKDRLAVEVERNDILLRAGRHRGLLPELAERTTAHPLDERLAHQLMLALYRSDRQAQALHQYERIRRQLTEELGTDPCAALQRLHQQILTADPSLLEPATRTTTPTQAPPVPRQLPAPPRGFVGRRAELNELTRRFLSESLDVLPVSTISGTGGVGKTWLALRWAHDQLARFPDGQFYVNLHGFDAVLPPVAPAEALGSLLDAMGVDRGSAPSSLDGQAGLFRSLVAGKRLLILLDNARDSAQVEPLLPGSPSSTVLVTSRNRLTGLSIRHGARALPLELLTAGEARDLLAHRLGDQRIDAEPGAAAELLDTCGGLPLALGIVAARATTYPCLPLGAIAEELREATASLDDDADPAASPRAVFAASYAALSPKQATAIGLLGIAPGPDIALPAAASLIGTAVPATRGLLHGLEELSLVQQYVPGRYRMHDLVRPYAAERAHSDLEADGRNAALRRLLDFYLHTAHAADQLLQPHQHPIQLRPPPPGCVPSPPASQQEALAWFRREHRPLLAIQATAAERGWNLQVWQAARVLSHFHRWQGNSEDNVTAWQAGLAAAERYGDEALQAEAHRQIGLGQARLGRPDEAKAHAERAIVLCAAVGDVLGEALALEDLAVVCEHNGDFQAAIGHTWRALDLFRRIAIVQGEAGMLNMVGWYYAQIGEYDQGHTCCTQALALYERYDDELGKAGTLDSLGYIAHCTGDYTEAIDYYRRSLALARKLGNVSDQAETLDKLGATYDTLGEHGGAREAWKQALEIYRDQGAGDQCQAVEAKLGSLNERAQPPCLPS